MKKINNISEYLQFYKKSIENPSDFWGDIAEDFVWHKKWDSVLKGGFKNVDFEWFTGGKLNITVNCLDRHLAENANKVAFHFEPNDPKEKSVNYSYQDIYEKVCQLANALKSIGVKKGDRVCIYLPMIIELPVALLACARIGAIHSVVFGGFSATAIADRINDSECKVIITADGTMRGNKEIQLKNIVDEALKNTPSIEKCIVVKRTGSKVNWNEKLDLDYGILTFAQTKTCEPEIMDAEDPLFILYTSGSTGKPKGIVHTIGGYMVYTAFTFQNVFQYRNKNEFGNVADTFWCTADIGWITGHSYITYGPLLNNATQVLFEGVPNYPDFGRFWDIIDKYKVTIFYTAPTAIRALEAAGLSWVENKNLSSLRILGTVGEPINHEAWEWYNKHIGKEKCPIVDTWWQTETGGIMISPLAGITENPPTFATLPMPGIQTVLMDNDGKEIFTLEAEGNLCIKQPWPSLARTTWGDKDRFIQTYFTTFPNYYFTGDACKRDNKGFYRITGRVDDVINVSGHRIGTAEVENAINEHHFAVESAVVGYPHPIKGQGIYAFVICTENHLSESILKDEINKVVTQMIGPFAKADKIQIVKGLPKTRSGKIMRRILRKLAEGELDSLGDTSTLLDPSVVDEIKNGLIK